MFISPVHVPDAIFHESLSHCGADTPEVWTGTNMVLLGAVYGLIMYWTEHGICFWWGNADLFFHNVCIVWNVVDRKFCQRSNMFCKGIFCNPFLILAFSSKSNNVFLRSCEYLKLLLKRPMSKWSELIGSSLSFNGAYSILKATETGTSTGLEMKTWEGDWNSLCNW